ncbi:L,D-transpeptidase [Hahella sp. SMD15-11]|uniref:L,D-transpeptidase n=1 Tax=Thermohahella caldifontis TaxID=3142973 RepID=A0AB39UYA4_9GAMM
MRLIPEHERLIRIQLANQTLTVIESGTLRWTCRISTAANGAGERSGSGCTPRGRHYIRARIGEGAPLNAVFAGRRPTGEIWSPELAARFPDRDWILTRIFWLCGLEPGRNRGGDCDTMRRYIYIHGTPDTEPMGIPRSHGCIRMHNPDLLTLWTLAPAGTQVWIEP